MAKLKADYPSIEIALNDNRAAAAQDIVFIGLHPPAFAGVFDEIKAKLKPAAIVVSLAPKVSIAKLSAGLGTARTMMAADLPPAGVMDLIPVKPLGEDEATIKGFYHTRLEALYAKLKS